MIYIDMSKMSEPTRRFVEQRQKIIERDVYNARFESLVDAVAKRISFMVDTSQAEGNILKLKNLIDSLGE